MSSKVCSQQQKKERDSIKTHEETVWLPPPPLGSKAIRSDLAQESLSITGGIEARSARYCCYLLPHQGATPLL
eukprot:3936-Heterococcus_DN1.PRE.8